MLEVGRQYEADEASLLPLLQRLQPFAAINRMSWTEWDLITPSLSTSDLVFLFRGVVVTEQLLKWKGGSVAAGIWLHRELMRRDEAIAVTTAAWAVQSTNNPCIQGLPTRLLTADRQRGPLGDT